MRVYLPASVLLRVPTRDNAAGASTDSVAKLELKRQWLDLFQCTGMRQSREEPK